MSKKLAHFNLWKYVLQRRKIPNRKNVKFLKIDFFCETTSILFKAQDGTLLSVDLPTFAKSDRFLILWKFSSFYKQNYQICAITLIKQTGISRLARLARLLRESTASFHLFQYTPFLHSPKQVYRHIQYIYTIHSFMVLYAINIRKHEVLYTNGKFCFL